MYHLYHCSILRRPLGNRKRISSREVHTQFFFKFVKRGKWSSVFYVLFHFFSKINCLLSNFQKECLMFWLLLNSMTVEEFSPPHHFFDKPWSKRWQRNFKSDHHTVLPFQFSRTEVTTFYFYFFETVYYIICICEWDNLYSRIFVSLVPLGTVHSPADFWVA